MNTWLLSGALAFVYVFLKANQQINVVGQRYAWIMPASLGMGLCEVWIVLLAVRADTILLGLMNGLCSGLGAMLAMYFHSRRNK